MSTTAAPAPPPRDPLYRGYRFPAEIISHAVWLYFRFALSHRDIEELLAERGVQVSYEAIRLWCQRFGPIYAGTLRRRRSRSADKWHIDEGGPTSNAGKPPLSIRPGGRCVTRRSALGREGRFSAELRGRAHGAVADAPGTSLPPPQWPRRGVGGEIPSRDRGPRLVVERWEAPRRAVIPPRDPAVAAPDLASS